jgi:hypothetical protein
MKLLYGIPIEIEDLFQCIILWDLLITFQVKEGIFSFIPHFLMENFLDHTNSFLLFQFYDIFSALMPPMNNKDLLLMREEHGRMVLR